MGPEVAPGVHPAAHLVEIVASSADSYVEARRALADGSTLIRSGALVAGALSPLTAPLWRAVTPSSAALHWLSGAPSPYRQLDREPAHRRATDATIGHHLDAIVANRGERPVRLVLAGERGYGRTRAAAALAERLDVHTTVAAGISSGDAAQSFDGAVLDARLRDHLLVIESDQPSAIAARIDDRVHCCILTKSLLRGDADAALPGFVRLDVRFPSSAAQKQVWRGAMGERLDDDAIDDLARGYSLSFGAIEEVAREAIALAGDDDEVLVRTLRRAAGAANDQRLSEIADRLSTTLQWDDLVLPDDTREAVQEVADAAKAQRIVFESWGYGAKTPYGRAISALFAGEPGTGKTMVATLIARYLGLELYRVDLSRLVDKYVGETEKHLAALFDEAENGRCVLLFDEADSLFGKRTSSGESANERYANMEVNYLLQRLETFSGIVLLTTNQESAIDPAFKRRIRYRVEFPFPDEDERALLWRRMLAADAPVGDDFDSEALASRFEMSGGHIKSAVLRAAFGAAAAGEPISQKRLIRAATQELENMGKLVHSTL